MVYKELSKVCLCFLLQFSLVSLYIYTYLASHQTVSGVHARLKIKDGSLLVMDLDSTNGTYVNDQKIKPRAVAAAFPGSSITFGTCFLE